MISLLRLLEQRKKYLGVIIALASLAGLNFVREVARYDLVMTDDQIRDSWVSLRDLHPELYPNDDSPIYSGERYKWYIPAYRAILRNVASWFDEDFDIALKFLGAVETFVFLISMFVLTELVVKNTTASFLASLAATSIRWCVGGTYWGVSGILSSHPRTMFLMFSPLFLWLFIRWRDSPKVYLAFLLVGIVSNIHPISGYLFSQILLLTFPSVRGFNRRGLQSTVLACIAIILGVSPYLLSLVCSETSRTFSGVSYQLWGIHSLSDILQGFLVTGWYLWLPFLLSIVSWVLLEKSSRIEQIHKILLRLVLITVFVSACGELANKLLFTLTKLDATFQYFRAFRFVYLPIFVFIGILFRFVLDIDRRSSKILLIAFLFTGFIFTTSRTYLRWLFPLPLQDVVQAALFRSDRAIVTHTRVAAERQAEDFEKVSLWARDNLPLGDFILIPPDEGRFLVTGRRTVRSAPECYEEPLAEKCFLDAVQQDKHTHFILVKNNQSNLAFESIYSNASYVVYEVRPSETR